MRKTKVKKIFTGAMSLLFALCLTYFAVLPPTSAWFYVRLIEDEKTFIFGTLTFDTPVEYFDAKTIDLPAATKLEDPDEAIAFDRALYIEEISATNDGSLPARVYLTVTRTGGIPAEFHYFFFDESAYDAAAQAVRPGKPTSVMDIIRTRKNQYTGQDANIITDGNAAATYTALNSYNLGDGVSGIGDEGNYVIVPPNSTRKIYIAFWADYNVTGATLETTTIDEHYTYDNIVLTLKAGQDTPGWFDRTP